MVEWQLIKLYMLKHYTVNINDFNNNFNYIWKFLFYYTNWKKAEYEVISTYFYKYNIYKNIYVLGGKLLRENTQNVIFNLWQFSIMSRYYFLIRKFIFSLNKQFYFYALILSVLVQSFWRFFGSNNPINILGKLI